MKIGFEAQRIFRTNKHGMDFVALEVLKELQKIDLENEYFVFVAPGDDECLKETTNFHIIKIGFPTYPLWEQVGLPLALNKYKPDILHCTSNTAPLYCKVPLIVTLHDIIFLEPLRGENKSTYQNLGRIYRKFVVPKILKHCKKIVTVSNYEKERIGNFLKLPNDKLIAIYNGFSSHFRVIQDTSSITSNYISEKEYIFFLGNTDPKKNVPGTLVAYSLYLKKSSKKLPLLLADLKEEILDKILEENNIREIKDYIKLSGYINNKDLPYIYNGANIFLYTSFRESFGIPLLEAMACGTPVITGNASALPEIAGDGGILIDVTKPENIAEMILKLETDKSFYESQILYGLERVKSFSWTETASNLLKEYKKIIKL